VSPVIDGERLVARLERLARIGRSPEGGTTREAYGPLDVEARDLVAGWMDDAGLRVEVDAAGNLVGRRTGTGSGRWLATGSHLDTVVEAGPLDGAYGVVAGVEVADALRHAGVKLAHDLVVVAFANEEGARGTDGMVGSRALVGDVSADELAAPDDEGVPLAQRLADCGGDPGAIDEARWDTSAVAAFVELHVEQGPVLDAGGLDLGVVLGITGRQALDIELTGAANHAGTTPMHLRHDALAAAAEVVLAVEAMAGDGIVRVATCGHVQAWPNVRNVVPGRVRLSAELRADDLAQLTAARPEVQERLEAIGLRRGVEVSLGWGQLVPPIAADPGVLTALRHEAERAGRPWTELWSGAGHDAQILAPHVPAAMLFVPSVGGVSHAPEERTDAEHLVAGAQLLADSLVHLDGVTS
jgi:hydantoinase/carbamoylase family amidase